MASLAGRIAQTVLVQAFRAKTKVLFSKYLLITNTTITVCLSGTGDFLQQRYEIACKRQTTVDVNRSRRICTTGLLIGPLCHYWYIMLDRFFPGRALSMVLKKVLVDQVVFSPVNISVFLVMMHLMEGRPWAEVVEDMNSKGKELLTAEWLVWPPAQLTNFYFIPLRFRVLFDNTVSLGFDYYYSYVMYRKKKPENEDVVHTLTDCPDSKMDDSCVNGHIDDDDFSRTCADERSFRQTVRFFNRFHGWLLFEYELAGQGSKDHSRKHLINFR